VRRPPGAVVLDEPVHLVAVRPVALDGDEGEPLLLDQPAGDGGPPGVVLVGAVGRLTEQHHPGIADPGEERVKIGRGL